MLLLTDDATLVIQSLLDRPEIPAGAGIRISSPGDGNESLVVSTVAEPEPADKVIEDQGARVFLDTTAAVILDDKVLSARVSERGSVEFLLDDQ